jgi:dimethylsulfone monooxygenase
MRIGIWTPLPHTIRPEPALQDSLSRDAGFAFATDILRRAESLGFDFSLIAERFLGPDLEAWLLATALSQHTSRMELLVAIHPGIVAPQVVAKFGATLDRISGGRFAVNLVNGWFEKELALFGQGALLDAPDARYRRMEEFLQVLSGLWNRDNFSFTGEFFTVQDATLPIRPQRPPPIYAASRAGPGKDVVARHADIWFVNTPTGTYDFDVLLPTMRDEIDDMRARAARHGRSITFAVSGHVINEPTLEAAERKADELLDYGKRDPMSAVAARALGAGLVGTPDILAERLHRLEEIGISNAMLHFHPMGDGMEHFADSVMKVHA